MKKERIYVICGVILATLFSVSLKAQDPEFTQFYASPMYLNPAFAGSAKCPRLVMNYRNQWPSLSGAFVTSAVSYDQHVDAARGGIGVMFMNDRAAQSTLSSNTISGVYSYQQPIGRKFAMKAALQVTYFQKSLDWSKLTFGDMIDPRKGFIYETADVPRGGKVSGMDFSAGVVGFTDKLYFGGAVHHLTEPNESLIVGTSRLPMKFTGHIGALLPFKRSFKGETSYISPNVLYRRQGEFQQLNFGTYVNKGPIVAGVWFRGFMFGNSYRDSFITTLGIKTDYINFGYSYDITISELTPSTGGSHEISVVFNFPCVRRKVKFRSVACPSF